VLEVEDQGAGVQRERKEEIFQIFYTTKPGGTGLGLPIARRLVESLGGTLELCEKEGAGACFRAVLPLEGARA
jgi:signal transduction histidine kinase